MCVCGEEDDAYYLFLGSGRRKTSLMNRTRNPSPNPSHCLSLSQSHCWMTSQRSVTIYANEKDVNTILMNVASNA